MLRRLLIAAFLAPACVLWAGTPVVEKSFEPLADIGEVVELPRNAFATVPGKNPDGWSFMLQPYVWALGIDAQIQLKDIHAVNLRLDPRKVLIYLDWGVFARAEVRRGKWGVLADGMFAQLSTNGTPPGPLYENASVQVQQGLASLALAYRVIDDRRWFLDVYAGARYNYFGVQLGASTNTEGIENLSTAVVDRLASRAGQRIESFIDANGEAIAATVEEAVRRRASAALRARAADIDWRELRDSLTPRQIRRILQIVNNRAEYRELVAATVQARLAARRAQLTAAIQNRVTQARKNLSAALAEEIENILPTSYDDNQWWIDPIVGLRGQVNFTRWLFLSFQGDVGGFGAGSEIAWNVQSSLGINFTRHLFAEVGYRFYYLEYEGRFLNYSGGESGVFTGVGVRF